MGGGNSRGISDVYFQMLQRLSNTRVKKIIKFSDVVSVDLLAPSCCHLPNDILGSHSKGGRSLI